MSASLCPRCGYRLCRNIAIQKFAATLPDGIPCDSCGARLIFEAELSADGLGPPHLILADEWSDPGPHHAEPS